MTRTTFTRRTFGLTLAATIATGGGAYLLRRPAASSPEEVAARAIAIGQANGLRIDYGNPASFFLPPYSSRDATIPDGHVTKAEITDVAAALDGIEQSLAVYPPGFYATLAKAIFICGTLRFGDERAGGTYGPAWIIIAADPSVGDDGIRETARLGVHHEFSSLLLLRQPSVQARWQALLPAGWQPEQRSDEALRHTGDRDVRDGFLSAYAATSLENDFNTYAETAFGAPDRLVALAAGNPRVRQKAELLLQAYEASDVRMKQTYQKLGLESLASDVPAMPADLHIAPVQLPTPTIDTAN